MLRDKETDGGDIVYFRMWDTLRIPPEQT
jgi:hypothetical protein